MELWEREIESIQRNIFLSARCVVLIEPHEGLREMITYAIGFLGTQYCTLPMTFHLAELWLQEREREQKYPSIFLFDCSRSNELAQAEHLLAQLQASTTMLVRPLKALVITRPGLSSLLRGMPNVDGVLLKPFKLAELRALILSDLLHTT